MSVVSSVLIQVNCAEDAFDDDGKRDGLIFLNAWLQSCGKLPLVELTAHMPRGKHPQTYVFGGGYNGLDEDEFARKFLSIDFEYPESAVLVINPEDGETRIWRPNY